MKASYRLTPTTTSQAVSLNNFRAASVFIENPTGSPVLIRTGGNDIPSLTTADHRVPAGGFLLIPVDGANFGIGLADPSAVTSTATSNLLTTATVTFLSVDEAPPQFGSANFQTLSLSDLTGAPVVLSGPATSAVYDLGSWGGALIYALLGNTSGQAILTVQASHDQSTWYASGSWALWPGVPVTISVARTMRFFRLVVAATDIPGEPAIAGVYTVRASLNEIQQTSFSAGSNPFVKAYSIPNGAGVVYDLCTVGLPGVNARLVNTSGSANPLTFQAYASSTGVTSGALVLSRTQPLDARNNRSLFRSIGQLEAYLRVTLSNGGGSTLAGTVAFSIPSEPDLTSILGASYAALGDVQQTTNTGQSIFHLLQTINTSTGASNTTLSTILGAIGATNAAIAGTNSALGAGNLTTILNSLVTTLAATNTLLTTAQTDRRSDVEYFFYPLTVSTSGTYTNSGPVLGAYAGRYVVSTMVNYRTTGRRTAPFVILFGLGGAGGVNEYLYRVREQLNQPSNAMPALNFGNGAMAGGRIIQASRSYIWAYADTPCEIDCFMVIR